MLGFGLALNGLGALLLVPGLFPGVRDTTAFEILELGVVVTLTGAILIARALRDR